MLLICSQSVTGSSVYVTVYTIIMMRCALYMSYYIYYVKCTWHTLLPKLQILYNYVDCGCDVMVTRLWYVVLKRRLSFTNLSSENNLPTVRLNAPGVTRVKVKKCEQTLLSIAIHYWGYTSWRSKVSRILLLPPCLLITVVQLPVLHLG